MTWLASNRWILIALSIGLLLALPFALDRCARTYVADVRESAAEMDRLQEQAAALHETLNQTEKANVAAETVRRDPDAARDECLRYARNPEDC